MTVNGDCLKAYEDSGDSGRKTYRYFCSECGTTIYGAMESKPGLVFVKARTLDDKGWFRPMANVYWDDHCSWIVGLGDLPKSSKMPTQ